MFDRIFDGSLMPHGHCLLWREDLLFMTILGDALTVLAYGLIPIALIYLVKKRTDLKFDRIFLLFAAFIAFCGITHAISLVNIWQGYYFIQGFAKLTTGVISVMTAFSLWHLMPKILAIPSFDTVRLQNEKLLKAQKELTEANTSLEQKVKDRTQALQQLANTDQLTQLKNRRAILESLQHELRRIDRYPSDLSLMMLDIDHFKKINDTYGHIEGDEVLTKVAKVLANSCRQTDLVGRYGGEEFLFVLPGTSLSEASELAERVREALTTVQTTCVNKVTCSIGISTMKEGKTFVELIKKADERVYMAKDLGRDKIISQS